MERGGLKHAETGRDKHKDEEQEILEAIKQLETFPELRKWLALQNVDLAAMFEARLGWDVLDENGEKWRPQREYVALFRVVSIILHRRCVWLTLFHSYARRNQLCKRRIAVL
jgi:hypothetical protein